jgi:hypothetical protein
VVERQAPEALAAGGSARSACGGLLPPQHLVLQLRRLGQRLLLVVQLYSCTAVGGRQALRQQRQQLLGARQRKEQVRAQRAQPALQRRRALEQEAQAVRAEARHRRQARVGALRAGGAARRQLARVQDEDRQQQVGLRPAGGVQRLVVRQPAPGRGQECGAGAVLWGGSGSSRRVQERLRACRRLACLVRPHLRSRLNHTTAALLAPAALQATDILALQPRARGQLWDARGRATMRPGGGAVAVARIDANRPLLASNKASKHAAPNVGARPIAAGRMLGLGRAASRELLVGW